MIIQRLFSEKKEKILKEMEDLEKKWTEERVKRSKDADKLIESVTSIGRHRLKAAELRAKKEAGEQLKKDLKKGGKIALATGGVVAAGIGAKKLVDKKKAKKEEKK